MARRATTVFPEPTSPCNNRCIGYLFDKSFSISAFISIWPDVYLNGNLASNAATKTGVLGVLDLVLNLRISFRRCPSNNCNSNASSKVNRCLAFSADSKSGG